MSSTKITKQQFKLKFSATQLDPILRFIQSRVRESRSAGVVVAVSGGIDSAVVACLAVKALGRNRVLGLLMFENEFRKSEDYSDARKLVSKLGIRYFDISITPILDCFKLTLSKKTSISKRALGNIKARIRMILLYAFANQVNLLVAGTGDKSEEEVGYFTKYGDGGVDFQPIAHLYKSQVRKLARNLGVPETIMNKPSSPNLWKGQKATDELLLEYPLLDRVLHLLYDRNVKPSAVAKKLGIESKVVRRVSELHEKNMHKARPPPGLDD